MMLVLRQCLITLTRGGKALNTCLAKPALNLERPLQPVKFARLLIVKTSSMGDVVHMLPAVTDIRRARPEIQIDWVVDEAFAELPLLHPGIRRVLPAPLRRWRRQWGRGLGQELLGFIRLLRAEPYDLILDTQGLLKSALITRLARGLRCGPDVRSARESPSAWFYDRTYAVARGRHAVDRNRELAALALGLPPAADSLDYGVTAPPAPAELGLPADYMVCLHGASRASKLWPLGCWLELVRRLAELGIKVVLPWSSGQERERAEAMAAAAPGSQVLPRLALRPLAGVLAGARAVVGLDSGLSHLAVALDQPTLALYLDTAPALTGLLGKPGRAVNLGGPGGKPMPADVLARLAAMGVISPAAVQDPRVKKGMT